MDNTAVNTKTCNQCNETKGVVDFYKNSSSPDGYRSLCKDCHNKNRGNVTTGTNDTIPESFNSSLGAPPLMDPPGTSGGFGTELVLAMGEDDGGMHDIILMCPCCNKYNVLFRRHLQAPGINFPFGICNDDILQVDSQLIRFYYDGDVIHIVRGISAAHLGTLYFDM